MKQIKSTGRPNFEVTEEMERQVSLAVVFGLTHLQIGKLVDCDPKTLRKYFRRALESGKERLTMDIGSQLYKKAMNGDTISAMFWQRPKADLKRL